NGFLNVVFSKHRPSRPHEQPLFQPMRIADQQKVVGLNLFGLFNVLNPSRQYSLVLPRKRFIEQEIIEDGQPSRLDTINRYGLFYEHFYTGLHGSHHGPSRFNYFSMPLTA